MTDKKKILIQLSEEDAEFFKELLAGTKFEILSSRDTKTIINSDVDYVVMTHDEASFLLKQQWDFLSDKRQFAHQIKNPLAHVIGYTDVMLGGMTGELTEQQELFLKTIIENARKILSTANDFSPSARLGNDTNTRMGETADD